MSGKFKVGDRVAVYGYDNEGSFWHGSHKTVAAVTGVQYGTVRFVTFGNGAEVHETQCRKLKPKVKKELRRIWVPVPSSDLFFLSDPTHNGLNKFLEYAPLGDEYKYTEFVEVRRKKGKSK